MNWASFLHKQKQALAILIDPDKNRSSPEWKTVMQAVKAHNADVVLVGGSIVDQNQSEDIIQIGKSVLDIPFVAFPGDFTHLHPTIDGLFFLSLISGRNPEFLIGQQVKAMPFVVKHNIETLPVGYMLLDGGTETSTLKVTQTQPLLMEDEINILHTAMAGERLGLQAIYLEAGSGAKQSVPARVVKLVADNVSVPVIVGGGIRSKTTIEALYAAGANLVVVGNHFEQHLSL